MEGLETPDPPATSTVVTDAPVAVKAEALEINVSADLTGFC